MSALKKIYIINKLPPFDPSHFTSPDRNSSCTQERAINYNYNQSNIHVQDFIGQRTAKVSCCCKPPPAFLLSQHP